MTRLDPIEWCLSKGNNPYRPTYHPGKYEMKGNNMSTITTTALAALWTYVGRMVDSQRSRRIAAGIALATMGATVTTGKGGTVVIIDGSEYRGADQIVRETITLMTTDGALSTLPDGMAKAIRSAPTPAKRVAAAAGQEELATAAVSAFVAALRRDGRTLRSMVDTRDEAIADGATVGNARSKAVGTGGIVAPTGKGNGKGNGDQTTRAAQPPAAPATVGALGVLLKAKTADVTAAVHAHHGLRLASLLATMVAIADEASADANADA